MSLTIGDARALVWGQDTVRSVVTSPPYWGQRDYGFPEQIGMEDNYLAYVLALCDVFDGVREALTDDGTVWLVLGDTYNTRAIIRPSSHQAGLGHDTASTRLTWAQARDAGLVRYSARQPGLKDKDLMGLPWLVVRHLLDRGWYCRSEVIWAKPYGAPENASDRPSRTHETIFLLSKSRHYYYAKDACPEARSSVWTIAPASGDEHRAVFPDELVRRCVLTTTAPGDVVGDPFAGSGTTLRVAEALGRKTVGVDGRSYA